SAKCPFKRGRALEVFAKSRTPEVGLSSLWTTPKYTLPALLYFSLRYDFTTSESGSSPVLSPWTRSPTLLFTTIRWLSSKMTWRLDGLEGVLVSVNCYDRFRGSIRFLGIGKVLGLHILHMLLNGISHGFV